jgi:hypothetical protein
MKRFCFRIPGRQQLGRTLFFATLLLLPVFPGPALAEEGVPPAILTSFESFSKDWMARLEQVNQQNNRSLKPESATDGRVVGRYICYGPDCMREVRGTESKATPYVGIIRYAQKVLEKEGDTPQKMRDHPGVPTNEIQVTEIFRYTKGRWVY